MAAVKALQQWCRIQCEGYRDVAITNMTTSFRDGLAFCALIHKQRPDLINFDSLKKEDVYDNNKLAFKVAEQELGIPALLDAEDMVALRVPDRLSILTYVSQYYNYFHGRSPIGGMGGIKRPAEGPAEGPADGPPGKKNQPVVAKVFSLSKPARENSPPPSSNITRPSPSPRYTRNTTQEAANEKSHQTGTLSNKCVVCNQHVHLVQRHLVEGKLYHRNCAKLQSPTGTTAPLRSLPTNTPVTRFTPLPDPVKTNTPAPTQTPPRLMPSSLTGKPSTPSSLSSTSSSLLPSRPAAGVPSTVKECPATSISKPTTLMTTAATTFTTTTTITTRPTAAPRTSATAEKTLEAKLKFFQSADPTYTEDKTTTAVNMDVTKGPKGFGKVQEATVGQAQTQDKFGKKEASAEKFGKKETSVEKLGKKETSEEKFGKKETSVEKFGKKETSVEKFGKKETSVEKFGKKETSEEKLGKKETNVEKFGKKETNVVKFGKKEASEEKFGEQVKSAGVSLKQEDNENNKAKASAAAFISKKLENNNNNNTNNTKPPLKKTDKPQSQVETPKRETGAAKGRVRLKADPSILADLQSPETPSTTPSPASKTGARSPDRGWVKSVGAPADTSASESASPADWRSRLKPVAKETKPVGPSQSTKPAANGAGKSQTSEISVGPVSPSPVAPSSFISVTPPASRGLQNVQKDVTANGTKSNISKTRPDFIPKEEIERELQEIEDNLNELEKRGVELEVKLRSSEEEGEDESLMDELMVEWFSLIRNKQVAVRRESELVYIQKTQDLEEEQPNVEQELRRLMEKPDHLKTAWDRKKEEQLMAKLMEIVNDRDAIVNGLDEDRLREEEEDQELNKMMMNLNIKKDKTKKKSPMAKLFGWGNKKEG